MESLSACDFLTNYYDQDSSSSGMQDTGKVFRIESEHEYFQIFDRSHSPQPGQLRSLLACLFFPTKRFGDWFILV